MSFSNFDLQSEFCSHSKLSEKLTCFTTNFSSFTKNVSNVTENIILFALFFYQFCPVFESSAAGTPQVLQEPRNCFIYNFC